MKLLIKEISTSRTEVRLTLNPISDGNVSYYVFGNTSGIFSEGSLHPKYIPLETSQYHSIGPNPGVIRLIVAFLKDTLGTATGSTNAVLVTKDGSNIPIVNLAVDDITLVNLSSDTVPTIVVKLLEPLPTSSSELDEIIIEKQIITTQEQDVYYISAEEAPDVVTGLAFDEEVAEEIGDKELQTLDYENYNQLTSSFNHSDNSIINDMISGSDLNLKVDYSDFKNHVHFGSAVSKLENFKNKVINIENNLTEISKSLATGSLSGDLESVALLRKNKFAEIDTIKNNFTPYEREIYYKSDILNYKYPVNLGPNYIKSTPINNSTKDLGSDGFGLVHKVSGSNVGNGNISLFEGLYNVEDKPFYNNSGSFYLSFLIKGDESINREDKNRTEVTGSINDNLIWTNYQRKHIPMLPEDTLHTSSILSPEVKSGSWDRHIYLASQSYWAPATTNPKVGTAGGMTRFHLNSPEVTILHNSNGTGSYPITLGSRYPNLATTVTQSGIPFTGSILPAGELFRLSINTNYTTEVTSSYLTDIKITRYNPINTLPFAEIYSTGSTEWDNWYNDQHTSASAYDKQNVHRLLETLPSFLGNNNSMDNSTFISFVNMMGEHFDLVRNYIDAYPSLFKTQYGEVGAVPDNLLPVLAKNYNWQFMLPYGKKTDAGMLEFMGSTLSTINNSSNAKNNIWRNIINNIQYIYKTKGTHRSIRALLNSYGFPPDILKIKEHGASLENFDDGVLSDNVSNLTQGIAGSTGSLSFKTKEDRLVSYQFDSSDRKFGMEWGRDSVNANSIEFVFKPSVGTNEQIIMHSSGSGTGSLWDIVLEPSGSNISSSKLTFRLNNTPTGSTELSSNNRISMSTNYHSFKNGNYWNVAVQRISGPSSSIGYNASEGNNVPELLVSSSYQLLIGEQVNDKVNVLEQSTMNVGGSVYSHSAANFMGTGSRHQLSSSNLIVGETYTGSIAEIRTWKQALSASKFKQHIFDKKSVVSNTQTGSRSDLIYHYRLNENWISGSTNPKIKDYNPGNVKDYSISFTDTMTGSLGSGSMYTEDVVERVTFNLGIGGAYEVSDNNIIIDPSRRFIDNLNPEGPSQMNVYHPLINKRKASSVLELTRSPQEVINDFILNQLGNFDFNDLFADPQDINEADYDALTKFAKEFFDYYDISLDVNKYIKAQAAIFNRDLINSLKRLVPARAQFSKVGVELKPTFFDRQKIQNNKLEKQILSFEATIPETDWDKNEFSLHTLDTKNPLHRYTAEMEIHSATGSQNEYYDFDDVGTTLHKTKDAYITIASHTGSVLGLTEEVYQQKEGHIGISSHTGSIPVLTEDLYKHKEGHIEIYSHTGSAYVDFGLSHRKSVDGYLGAPSESGSFGNFYDFSTGHRLFKTKDVSITIASETGSVSKQFTKLEPLVKSLDGHIRISSNSGSITRNFTDFLPIHTPYKSQIVIASHTGSSPTLVEIVQPTYDNTITVANETGSISKDFTKFELLHTSKDGHIVIASETGSINDFTKLIPLHKSVNGYLDRNVTIDKNNETGSILLDIVEHKSKDVSITIASETGSISKDFTKLELLHTSKDGHIPIASETGSVYNFTSLESLYKNYNGNLDINVKYDNTKTGSILLDIVEHKSKDTHIPISSESGSQIYNFNKLQPLYTYMDVVHYEYYDTGSNAYNLSSYEPLYKNVDTHLDKNVTVDKNNETGSILLQSSEYKYNDMDILIADATSSKPGVTVHHVPSKDAKFKFQGDKTFYEHTFRTFEDLSTKWGTGPNDVHFINYTTNPEPVGTQTSSNENQFNNYHYEKRYLFHTIGDVETVSGSVPNVTSSFVTDYMGNLDNGVYTASRHFSNQIFIKTNEVLGYRPLGTTIEFKPSSSIDFKGGKFFNEEFVYPANHTFIVGSSRDSIDRLIYKGTQNKGGDVLESEAFTDLDGKSVYYILTTGGQGYTVEYN